MNNSEDMIKAGVLMRDAAESMRQTYEWQSQLFEQQKQFANDWLDRYAEVLRDYRNNMPQ